MVHRIDLLSPVSLAERIGPHFTRPVATDFIATGVLGPIYSTQRGDLVAAAEVDRVAAAPTVDFAALTADPVISRGIFAVRCGPPAQREDGSAMGVDIDATWEERVVATAGRWHVGANTRDQIRGIIADQGFVPMVVLTKSWPVWGFEITDMPTEPGPVTFPVRPPGTWFDQHLSGRWMQLGRGSTAFLANPSAFA
ncbi:MAG: hypothetical protein DI630_16550 [Gordonia sp. (in: high G+C Gram-positive bacteria)]|nr:MAG: hypothetical protein DI630_16550 [Gordonia sp. (in: high G+C Gram-positive bacteria)]